MPFDVNTERTSAEPLGSGLTQVELAKKLGWQQTDISKVERGGRRLDVVELLQFAKAIGFEAGEFIEELQRGR